MLEEHRRCEEQLQVGARQLRAGAHEAACLGDVRAERALLLQHVAGDPRNALVGAEVGDRSVGVERRDGREVVLQTAADVRRVDDDVDAERQQLLSRSDAGQQEQLRGAHRPAAQHDLAGRAEDLAPAAHIGLDADGAAALDDHACGLGEGADLEVRALQGGREEGRGGAGAHALALGDLVVADALLCRAVEVVVAGQT